MNLSKSNFIIFLLIFIVCSGNFFNAAWAESFITLKLDANRVPWTELSFHAKNFWVDVSTDVHLVSIPAAEIETLMITTPTGIPIRPETPEAYQMTINTTIKPTFRSPVNIYNRIWFNPSDARALGRIRLRRGDDDFKKIYRFTKQGVFRHRMEPKNNKEVAMTPEKWTDIHDNFYPFDQSQQRCPYVSERTLLIYILSSAAISELNNSISLCVFGKRQLHRVQLRKDGIHPIKFSYIEKTPQTDIHREGLIKTHKINIKAEPISSDLNKTENFSFLGFHKDISIYIDPISRLPIQASGIIPTIGKAHLK
jgi:hypothetical protein